jgi:3-phenylpropionate/trans-cinnamate dioxygenase ferredoxin subunit
MSFVSACRLADIPERGALAVKVDGVPVAVVRAGDGEVYAIYDICSHAEVSLAEGEVDGTTLECWLHGSRFDLHTGAPTALPATEPVPVYPVRVEGDGDDAAVLVDVTTSAA